VKIASGCDRRCTFCAIPRFRGAYLSRPVAEVVAEVGWLVTEGVREVFLVSENTTSYGKDLGDIRLLEQLLVELSAIDRLEWIRVSYLQPAELRPSLVAAITDTDKVVPYFDLSFQHAAPAVLRRMRRFGDPDAFLDLIDKIRAAAPRAGIRSNVICGFPGETDADQTVLHDFLVAAELDAVGVFGYSDEDGTEAVELDGHVDADEIRARVEEVTGVADDVSAARAHRRIGESVEVLVEEVGPDGVVGRAACQGPEVDGSTTVLQAPAATRVGDVVVATVVDSVGVDLVAAVGSDQGEARVPA
jgi:MiaB/RimO family radical SAM methylthiotransferase